jgi:hypothetical protein
VIREKIMRQAVRYELCTGVPATEARVSEVDAAVLGDDIVAGVRVIVDPRVPRGHAWVGGDRAS